MGRGRSGSNRRFDSLQRRVAGGGLRTGAGRWREGGDRSAGLGVWCRGRRGGGGAGGGDCAGYRRGVRRQVRTLSYPDRPESLHNSESTNQGHHHNLFMRYIVTGGAGLAQTL